MRKLLLSIAALAVATCSSVSFASDYTKTRYPILLVHGVTGFDTIGGLIDYFYHIPWNLERSGAKVYTSSVSFVNSSENRGQQLASFINTLPESKLNLFAHSQGAPTARVAASLVPWRIASITSIDGVNKGSKVADVIRGILPPGSYVEGGVAAIANALGDIVNALSNQDHPQDAIAALETLTTPGTTQLNDALGWKGVNRWSCAGTAEDVWIGGNKIKFFSWNGSSPYTNVFDVADPFLAITSKAFGNEPNDGLVSACESMMGTVIGTRFDMNHVDAINQLFGVNSIWFDPVSLYRQQANRLKNKGL